MFVCLLATVNRAFRGASYADFVWEPKLPLNYEDVLGRVFKEEEAFVRESSFKKDGIYSSLCCPNSFDNGPKLSKKKSGKRKEIGVSDYNLGRSSHLEEDDCDELFSLLINCVEQIGSKDIAGINHSLAKLGQIASPMGSSSVHRLAAYYTEALSVRVAKKWPHIFHLNWAIADDHRRSLGTSNAAAFRFLNQVTPILKFIHFTSNEILLRALEGKDRIHIIDFDIKQGLQWPCLFQSLSSRSIPPSHVRITGIGESKQDLVETGDHLSCFAEALNLPFEFHPVVDRLEDLRLWMLHVKDNEAVVANCSSQLHKLMYDNTGGKLHDFMGLIHSTNAEAVVIAEQEASHNEEDLDSRVVNSLKYYSAIFDSLDSSIPLESKMRERMEEMYGSEIGNIVSDEGSDRIERHECFDKWGEMMRRGGFISMGINEREIQVSKMILKMHQSSEKYSVVKQELADGGGCGVTLSWVDQALYSVSGWRRRPHSIHSFTGTTNY